jgi:hypothetical protein
MATADSNGMIDPSGLQTVVHGEDRAFYFIPNDGYEIDELTVDGALVPNPTTSYTFTNVTADHTIHVSFKTLPPGQYTVTVLVDPEGSGTVTGGGTYTEGSMATVTAYANEGYEFVNWTKEGGGEVSVLNPYSFIVTESVTLVAHFRAVIPETYTINVTVNNSSWGTVTGAGVYEAGTTATLQAHPATNCFFLGWVENGDTISKDVTLDIVVDRDRELLAVFSDYTAVDEFDTQKPQVWYHSETLYFKNLLPNTVVSIYDIQGRIIHQGIPTGERMSFTGSGIYLVQLMYNKTVHTTLLFTNLQN